MDVQMPSGLIIPSSLKYSLYRMIQDAAISTNVLRLIPLNLQTVKSGGLISVRLPLATCSLAPARVCGFNSHHPHHFPSISKVRFFQLIDFNSHLCYK